MNACLAGIEHLIDISRAELKRCQDWRDTNYKNNQLKIRKAG